MLKRVFASSETGKLGGVNLLDDPKRIGDGELAWAKNIWPNTPGVIGLRKGTQYASMFVPGGSGNGWVEQAHSLDPTYPSLTDAFPTTAPIAPPILAVKPPSGVSGDMIYVTRGTQYASSYSNTAVRVVDFATLTTLASADMGVVTKRRPAAFFYNNKYYVFAGTGANSSGKIVQNVGAGLEIANFVFVNSPGMQPAVACQYRDRFVYGNFGPGYEHTLVFSDIYNPTTVPVDALATNGRNFVVGSSEDGDLVALVPVMLTAVGSPAQQGLLILHEYAAHLLTGTPNESGDGSAPLDGDVTIARVSFNCGCASAESVVTTPYGVIWAGHDDVWLFASGQVPVRIGSKIRPALAQTPAALRYLWHAAYYNGSYRLAVLSAGQGASDDSPCGDQWWLDLREGAPAGHERAVWWGPQQFKVPSSWDIDPTTPLPVAHGTRTMSVDNTPGADPILYGSDWTNFGLYVSNFENNSPRDGEGFSPGGLTVDLLAVEAIDSEISFQIITKDYDYGDAEIDKLWNGIELSVWTSYAEQLTVLATLDGGYRTDTQGLTIPQTPYATNVGTVE